MPISKSDLQAQIIRELLAPHINADNIQQSIRVASAAHLSRRVAYELDEIYMPDEQSSIHVFDEDGEIRVYNIQFIYTMHLGIVSYILSSDSADNSRVHLIFRGTKDAPAWCRNTEHGGPGHMSFHLDKDLILETVCSTLQNHPTLGKIQLFISGHSLGGADAQNSAVAIITSMAHNSLKNPEYSDFSALQRINIISINHANSAGITKIRATECKLHAKYLSKELGVRINVMCILTAGDGVQQSGQGHILDNIEPEIARVDLVKLSSDYAGWINIRNVSIAIASLNFTYIMAIGFAAAALRSAYKAHKMRFFDHAEFKNQSYKIYNNLTEEGRLSIRGKLEKHPLDNSLILNTIQSGMSTLQYYLVKTKRPPKSKYEDFVLVSLEDIQPDLSLPNEILNQQDKQKINVRSYCCIQ